MFTRILLLTGLLVSFGAVSAHAQNYGKRSTDDFTGPYVGGTVGYSWGDFDADVVTAGVTTASDDPDMDGWQGGLLGGYGFQFDTGMSYGWNGFLGAEVAYEWSNADGSAFGVGVNKEEAMLVTLRPGMAWGDTALGYGIIGYSRTQFDAAGEEEWLDGLVLGAGTELYTVGPFKTRLEYVYTNYEDMDYAAAGSTLNVEGQDHALKLGAIFRF